MITKAKVNGCNIINAQQVLSQISDVDWAAEVNQLNIHLGCEPSFSQFLIDADDFATFGTGPFSVELNELTLSGFVLVRAQSAFRMVGSPVLITIADRRYLWQDRSTARQWESEDFQTIATAICGDVSGANVNATLTYNAATEGRMKYEGAPTLAALEDFAFRSRHVLTFNPITDTLSFAALWSSPASIAADVYRNFEYDCSPDRLTKLHVIKQLAGEDVTRDIHNLTGSAANDRSLSVWLMAEESSEVTAEVDRLKISLGDLNTRDVNSKVVEYFGALSVSCGPSISKIRWRLDGPLITTTVWYMAPIPKMVKLRQLTESNDPILAFTLTEDMAAGLADADLENLDGTPFDPAAGTVVDTNNHYPNLVSGDKGVCVFKFDQFFIIDAEPGGGNRHFLFTLTEDMGETTANEASAELALMDGTALDPDEFDVLDPQDIFKYLSSGARGICFFDNGEYYIVAAQQNNLFECTVTASVSSSGIEATADLVLLPTVEITFDLDMHTQVGRKLWVQIQPDNSWKVVSGLETHFRFTLSEDMGNAVAGQATANLDFMGGSMSAPSSFNVRDSWGIFDTLESADKGICIKDGSQFFIIQAECTETTTLEPEPEPL